MSSCTDPKRVKLLRYDDPVLGPRKLPIYDQPQRGKSPISNSAVFCISVADSKISIKESGKLFDIGYQMAYLVNWDKCTLETEIVVYTFITRGIDRNQ